MIADVIRREGGYVDNPADRGGPTNMGITRQALATWRGTPVTADDVRELTREEAASIYRTRYYEQPNIDILHERIRPELFDMSVNHGPANAVRMLQQVLNEAGFGPLQVDGLIGPRTIDAATRAEQAMGDYLVNALVDERLFFYRRLVARRPSQRVFLRGWVKRAEQFRRVVA